MAVYGAVVKINKFWEQFQHVDLLQSYNSRKKNGAGDDTLMTANERQIVAVLVSSDPVDWVGVFSQVLRDVLQAGGHPGKIDASTLQTLVFFARPNFQFQVRHGCLSGCPEDNVGLTNGLLRCTSFGKSKPVIESLAGRRLYNIARQMYPKIE